MINDIPCANSAGATIDIPNMSVFIAKKTVIVSPPTDATIVNCIAVFFENHFKKNEAISIAIPDKNVSIARTIAFLPTAPATADAIGNNNGDICYLLTC
ncbi:MAG: hypothetical protein P1U47_17150 [Zhongshania sp.]|nr:hypothetical protein [Zhongshania sp.]MDF1694100.1 hypothetical protein [Zhongshania sp.]